MDRFDYNSHMHPVEPATAEALAKRYVWWQDTGKTLRAPETLLRQILSLGTADDYAAALEIWGEPAFRDALQTAPPGTIDARSWHYWHLHYGMPEPPLRKRQFS